MKPLAITALITTCTLVSALGQAKDFDFKDPKGVNNATFKLDAPLETITGSANGVSGTLTVNPEDPAATKGKIIIDAKSLHVENPVMKEHLHGKEWIDSAAHGEISFAVTGLKNLKQDGNVVEATVEGDFLLKGVKKTISAPAKVTLLPGKLADRTNGKMKGDLLVVRSSFTIKRSDFGINTAAPTDKVADEIEISLAIAGAAPEK
jgi:polyisoprenoid-binding protein YceI